MENPNKGDRVRLADRIVITAGALFDGDGNKVKDAETETVKALGRVGVIVATNRALSADGRKEIVNCKVKFPEVTIGKKKFRECTEIHEAGALVEAPVEAAAAAAQAGYVSVSLALVFALACAAALLVSGAWAMPDLPGVLLSMAVAAPAREGFVRWGRKREPMKNFQNVAVGTAAAPNTAYSIIPWHPRTVLGFFLEKGGTTFTNTHIPRIEIFLGETSIWGPVSAADLQMTERYVHGAKESGMDAGNDSFFLPLDFTHANVKEIGGEQLGGLDLVHLRRIAGREAQLRLEVDITNATAPQLRGETAWSAPQGGSDFAQLMRKLIKRTYPTQPAGDWFPEIDVRGAILCRQFFKGTVFNNAVATAGTAANNGTANTGNGTVTATVSALTPAGRYKAVCVEPGANVGTFIVSDPKGNQDGVVVTGAGATTLPSGLVVTATDGATDFAVGDTFFLDVLPTNTDGNFNLIEISKNEDKWFFMRDRVARLLGQRYGRTPMAGVLVADYLFDNHGDGVIDTADAATLDYRVNLTAQDTPSILHEVLATPTYLARNRNG